MDREQDIPFVYEDGVLKPEGSVNLPDGARGVARIRGFFPDPISKPGQPRDPFWHGKSVDELAAEQGVKPLRSIEDLRGDWPAEDSIDQFLDELRKGRR